MKKRIKNILLLARSIARFIIAGKANRVPKKISRILIVPTGKLGDVVCTTPVFRAVRKHFPEAKIIACGNSKLHKTLLADSGLADEYVDGPTDADIALVTGPSFELAAPLYLAGIPLVSMPRVSGGFSDQVTRPYRVLEHFVATYPYRVGQYAPRERVRSLEPLGIIENDTTKRLGFSTHALEKVEQFLSHHGVNLGTDFLVGLTPSAGHKIKEWPEERFAKVADYLYTKHKAKIIILGGPSDSLKVDKVISLISSKEKILRITDFNIDELKALISKLNLFISVDTGPIYIAESFNVPTIDITGPIDENEQPPRGSLHRNVVPPNRKKPELYVLNAKTYNREEALRQVHSITPELVEKEIDLLIEFLGK